jgi:hypothetical protein
MDATQSSDTRNRTLPPESHPTQMRDASTSDRDVLERCVRVARRHPREALYLPSRWWHQVRSLGVSASFNFWWADGPLALVVRAAEWVKKTRKLEINQLPATDVADSL